MFVEPTLLTSIIQAALLLGNVEARVWLLGRDRQAVYARGFGREQSAVSREIAADCTGGICDTLAGEAVSHQSHFFLWIFLLYSKRLSDDQESRGCLCVILVWLLRSLRYWLPNPDVHSRTWPIRSSVCVLVHVWHTMGRLTQALRHFSPIRPHCSGLHHKTSQTLEFRFFPESSEGQPVQRSRSSSRSCERP